MVHITADGPILLFGGPYSNLEATRAVLAAASDKSIPYKNVICTGDVVAYCAEPQETVDLLMENNIAVVMGNCEEQLGQGADNCGCGFEEGTTCEVLSDQWYTYSVAHLNETARHWMLGLPRNITLEMACKRFAIIHGGVSFISKFMFNSLPDTEFEFEIKLSECDGVIGGHCGIPFTKILGDKVWHNPGVIGMPANDGTPRGWYSILTPGSNGLSIQHHALNYNHRAAAEKMRNEALPIGYADCLENGLWPSLDVLPTLEKTRAGLALDLSEPIFLPN